MTVELTLQQAEALIEVLHYAEAAALFGRSEGPRIVKAIGEIKSWRAAMIQTYISEKLAEEPQEAGS